MKSLFVLVAACSPMAYTHGIPNLAQVDASVYRSGEPTAEGWAYFRQLAHGRRVHIVKLNFDTEGSDAAGAALGFDIVYLPMQPRGDQDVLDDARSVFLGPDKASVERAVAQLRACLLDPAHEICLVHCTHGQDRTGYVVGRHRVENEGWSKSRAYQEMRAHHFHWELHGIADAWEDWVPMAVRP